MHCPDTRNKPQTAKSKQQTANIMGDVDADDASLTVTWPPLGKHQAQYSLQYRPLAFPEDNSRDSGGSRLYTSLSASLAANSARKRNLTRAGHGFWFRVSVKGTAIA